MHIKYPEQVIADLLRTYYRLGILSPTELDRLCDLLQLRLFRRELANRGVRGSDGSELASPKSGLSLQTLRNINHLHSYKPTKSPKK